MSNPEERPHISGMLTAPEEHTVEHAPNQPRQPTSLHGLLRFAMEATESEAAAPPASDIGPVDEERKRFLNEALKSMTVDVIDLLQTNVQLLRNANTLAIDADISDYLTAFETILEYIDRIDTAIDFHKIGGFVMFPPCLNSVHAQIRAAACDLLAELCQNNPYCQNIVAETGLMKQILELLDKDVDSDVQIKALYAVSCNVRENVDGYKVFLDNDGLNIVHRALQRPVDKLRTKATFLLSCLCTSYPDLKKDLLKMDILPALILLISQERMPSHEHILSLLCHLITDNAAAIEQCTDPQYNFKNVLKQHLIIVQGKQQFTEEKQYCELLLNTIFKNENNDAER